MRRSIATVLVLACLLTVETVAAQTRVGVIYPHTSPAVAGLFQTIIDGMATAGDVRIQSRSVDSDTRPDEVKAWLAENRTQVTVTLGELPASIAEHLAGTGRTVRGAVPLNDNSTPGVSLSSSPAQMFARLRQIKPDVERVFVVYRPQNTGWLIGAARVAAREQGLDLTVSACEDVQQAVAALGRFVQQSRPGRDAIWLTLDPVVPMNQMLPVLLRESWDRQIVLFSNNPMDVAKGALFALYPNYAAMGRQLAEYARRHATATRPLAGGPEANESLLIAVNVRTASHLGLTLGPRQLQTFDRVFPAEPR